MFVQKFINIISFKEISNKLSSPLRHFTMNKKLNLCKYNNFFLLFYLRTTHLAIQNNSYFLCMTICIVVTVFVQALTSVSV